MTANISKKAARKDREQMERQFLSAVLADIDMGSPQGAAKYPGVTWRHFSDQRHQALWRAIQALGLAAGTAERVDALVAASGNPPEYYHDNRGATKELIKQATGIAWLEHCLGAAGALPLAGGKLYVRELCESYPVPAAAGIFARLLGFEKEEGTQ